MKQSFIDYIAQKPGYLKSDGGTILRRPDDTIVAKLQGDKWSTNPTQQELADYGIFSGRGLPSLLCYKGDPTNPGAH